MITGTLAECIQHYLKQVDFKQRIALADFVGVTRATTTRWTHGKHPPTGKVAIKVRALLTYLKYTITDSKRDAFFDQIEALIAFGVLSFESVIKYADCTEASFLRWVRGEVSPTSHGIQKLEELVAMHMPALDRHRAKWLHLFFVDNDQIVQLSQRIQQMIPLAEEVASDKFSVADRSRLRQLAGNGVVFKLYNILGQLCGEQARILTKAKANV